mmetsp:Transcript_10231/g.32561  ORF Transcript_10231/g.32561 Transcript_10231/m.32561 type:complete len:300 (-) Transcript_10231:198-1097(-)
MRPDDVMCLDERDHNVREAPRDVGERQVRQGPKRLIYVSEASELLDHRPSLKDEVVVAHHDGLGVARGTAREDELCATLRAPLVDAGTDFGLLALAEVLELVVREKLDFGPILALVRRLALGKVRVPVNNCFDVGEVLDRLNELVACLVAVNENKHALGELGFPVALLRRVRVVNAREAASSKGGADAGEEPLWRVAAEDAHAVMRLEPKGDHAGGDGARFLVVLLKVPGGELHWRKGRRRLAVHKRWDGALDAERRDLSQALALHDRAEDLGQRRGRRALLRGYTSLGESEGRALLHR